MIRLRWGVYRLGPLDLIRIMPAEGRSAETMGFRDDSSLLVAGGFFHRAADGLQAYRGKKAEDMETAKQKQHNASKAACTVETK